MQNDGKKKKKRDIGEVKAKIAEATDNKISFSSIVRNNIGRNDVERNFTVANVRLEIKKQISSAENQNGSILNSKKLQQSTSEDASYSSIMIKERSNDEGVDNCWKNDNEFGNFMSNKKKKYV